MNHGSTLTSTASSAVVLISPQSGAWKLARDETEKKMETGG